MHLSISKHAIYKPAPTPEAETSHFSNISSGKFPPHHTRKTNPIPNTTRDPFPTSLPNALDQIFPRSFKLSRGGHAPLTNNYRFHHPTAQITISGPDSKENPALAPAWSVQATTPSHRRYLGVRKPHRQSPRPNAPSPPSSQTSFREVGKTLSDCGLARTILNFPTLTNTSDVIPTTPDLQPAATAE